ncbi:MAG TPA: response regulator [Kofleriaceae bacterium]
MSASRPVILVVDDEPGNLGAFARSFRKEFEVLTADSGAAALAAMESRLVDVVITDYTMPNMNGIDVLQAVAAQWPAAKRLIVSGHADLEILHDAARSGLAAQLLPKPWNKAEMLATIWQLLA